MVRPAIWGDAEKAMWGYDRNGDLNNLGCGKLNLPEDIEFDDEGGTELDCPWNWFSGGSEIPGKRTLTLAQMEPEVDCSLENTEESQHSYPWNAPGSAPVFSPCGALGGFPNGCVGAEKFGDVCSCDGKDRPTEAYGCGGFAYGGLAHQYDWPNAPVTEWKAGSVEDVALWFPYANHGGGYSYRLCKTPAEGISGLTEECFQNGYLDFSGDTQWVYYGTEYIKSQSKVEMNATRITKGTFPPGSMWTTIPFSYFGEIDTVPFDMTGNPHEDPDHGHIIDKVRIPSTLKPGEYVLSFRYDCKCTSQVFNTCANIQITN